MQTIIGFSFKKPRHVAEILAGLERLKSYYSELSRENLELKGWVSPTRGLAALVPKNPPSNWPMWSDEADLTVATQYVPLGWKRVVPNCPLASAPEQLFKTLQRQPHLIGGLSPPFALFALDKRSLSLHVINDGLGYARVYNYENSEASVIASRVEAASIFLGDAPAISQPGWRTLSGCGWFMGDTTSLAGVTQLSPGTIAEWSDTKPTGDFVRFDALSYWTGCKFLSKESASEAVAEELLNFSSEVSALWNSPPTLHLSGGRDSRAAAAAFVSGGVPARFHTVASLKGELEIAEKLLAAVGRESDHGIVMEHDSSVTGDVVDRTVRLQQAYGGIYGPAGVKQPLFAGFTGTKPVVTGAAGEIARGNYYKANFLNRIRSAGPKGSFERLSNLYAFHGCVRPEVREEVDAFIHTTLMDAEKRGITDAHVLDYFYLVERLRRWSNASTKIGTLTPLASPAYIQGAFSQTPEEKLAEEFHLSVISRLVPAWRDIPFYKAMPEDVAKRTRPWIWNSGDNLRVQEIINSPDRWEDFFLPTEVRQLWEEAVSGGGAGRHEIVIHRVIWRYAFDQMLVEISRASLPSPNPHEYYLEQARDGLAFQRIAPVSS